MSGQEVLTSMLPVWVVIIPLLTTLLLIVFSRLAWVRHGIALVGTALTMGAVVSMYPQIIDRQQILAYEIPFFISPLNLTFKVDALGFIVALIASLVWLAATIYAISYMDHEKNQGRFFVFLALTLVGTIGIPLAGDLLTLLVFFEIMTLASYVLVVHNQSDEAVSAGNLYLYMGIFGGLSLLMGIGIIFHISGSVVIAPMMEPFSEFSTFHLVAMVLLILGFGIKAGMAPLHIWLPRAHPIAPSPASALLSGIMIKTGAYGIIRTVNMLFTPQADRFQLVQMADQFAALWTDLARIGQVMIWIGIVTMFFGAVSAMLQDNIKRMLACSSISQMGYIIMGVGAAAYIGYNGAMGLAGSSFHILNHALFKSALFLVAGVIVYALGELDMRELGGLARKMPFSMAIALIASFGIVGIPFFNGYSSKTLLHHAIVKAQHLEQLPSLQVAEWIFILTSACTVCYFIKFLYYTFFRKSGRIYAGLKAEPPLMKVGMGILGIAMLAFGFFPNLVLDKFILPALNNFMFDPANIEQYLAGINFWVLEDIWSIVITLGLGIIIYGLAAKTNFFRIKVPQWLTQEYIGYYIGRGAVILWGFVTMVVNFILNIFAWFFGVIFRATFRLHQGLDYKPHSPIYRAVNFGNIDFDIFLVLTVLGAILFCLFYLQFGI